MRSLNEGTSSSYRDPKDLHSCCQLSMLGLLCNISCFTMRSLLRRSKLRCACHTLHWAIVHDEQPESVRIVLSTHSPCAQPRHSSARGYLPIEVVSAIARHSTGPHGRPGWGPVSRHPPLGEVCCDIQLCCDIVSVKKMSSAEDVSVHVSVVLSSLVR